MADIDKLVRSLEKKFPYVPHTHAGRLFSAVRRMKAEKELRLPINRRTGVAISVKNGKAANEMSESEWEEFYAALCGELKQKYPELYQQLFPQ